MGARADARQMLVRTSVAEDAEARGGAIEVIITCLGKALANGLPLSALVGRKDVMQLVNKVFYALTYQHDSVALAVSRACLRYYRDHPVAATPISSRGGASG